MPPVLPASSAEMKEHVEEWLPPIPLDPVEDLLR
jgi:hypothetical protein